MSYIISPPPIQTLTINGKEERVPVNRIFCVGRNYAEHSREMGADEREEPFFFMKPATALVAANDSAVEVPYPPMTTDYQHEVELVAVIKKPGDCIPLEEAEDYVLGYGVGLDMTRRDLQLDARNKGRPWEFGKSFTASAPIGPISLTDDFGHPRSGEISVTVNDEVRQKSDISFMIWPVAECIAYLSQFEQLQAGDVIMTGTPKGVSSVNKGDLMHGKISGLCDLTVKVK